MDIFVDPIARRKSAIFYTFKTFAIVFGISAAIKLSTNTPLLSFAYSDLIALAFAPVLFWGRSRWGDRLSITNEEICLYRGDKLRHSIPLDSIQKVSGNKSARSVTWTSEGRTRQQTITREGFSESDWNQLISILQSKNAA